MECGEDPALHSAAWVAEAAPRCLCPNQLAVDAPAALVRRGPHRTEHRPEPRQRRCLLRLPPFRPRLRGHQPPGSRRATAAPSIARIPVDDARGRYHPPPGHPDHHPRTDAPRLGHRTRRKAPRPRLPRVDPPEAHDRAARAPNRGQAPRSPGNPQRCRRWRSATSPSPTTARAPTPRPARSSSFTTAGSPRPASTCSSPARRRTSSGPSGS